MKKTKKVKIQVVSERGHDTFMLETKQALNKIREETQQFGKWCYIDGKFHKADKITEKDIKEANTITLVNALQGG